MMTIFWITIGTIFTWSVVTIAEYNEQGKPVYQDNDDKIEALMGMVIEVKKIHSVLPRGDYAVEPILYILFQKNKADKKTDKGNKVEI